MWRQGARSRLYETDDADPAAALGSSASRATPTASPCRATLSAAAAAPTPPIPVSRSRECHQLASALEAAALVEASEGEVRRARTPVPPAESSRRSYAGAAAAAAAAHRPHWCG